MSETRSSGSAIPTLLAPLPALAEGIALQPIRASRRVDWNAASAISSASLAPLFYAAMLFLAGIVFARLVYLRPGSLLASLLPMALVAIFALSRAPRLVWLPLAFVWLILGAWSAETERLPSPDPAVRALSDGLMRTVEGTVVDAGPLRTMDEAGSEDESPEDAAGSAADFGGKLAQRIDLEPSAAEVVTDASDYLTPVARAETAKLRLNLIWPASASGSARPVECGERLRVVVSFRPPEVYRDPGVWNRADYLQGQGVAAAGSVVATRRDSDGPRLAVLGRESTSATCLLNRWRGAAVARLESLIGLTRRMPRLLRATPEDAAMLAAMLTGDRTYLTRGLRAGFERTGSFHLIVVSGLHLAVLAGCVFGLARRLRLPHLPTTILTISITLAYALFTGFGVPAQRSFWMITLYLVGRLLYRDRSPLNAIGFATLCLAVASPRSIFDASLQMTLISVAAIAGIAIPLLERTLHARVKATRDLRLISLDPRLPPRIAQFRVTLRLLARHLEPVAGARIAWTLLPFAVRSMLRIGELVFVTLVVELALALPMAIYFHRITVYALPVNLFILPLLEVLLPVAMLLLLALSVWPAVAVVPGAVVIFLLHVSVWLVRGLGGLSLGDLRVPDPAMWQIAVALVLFVLALLLARETAAVRRLAFVALAGMAAVALWPRAVDHPANAMLFEAIDVGQGDSLLLITPDGKTLLVDAGGIGYQTVVASERSLPEFDVGEEVVSAALWSRGIRRLDAVTLTHAHQDHMGGMAAILRNFRPREFWVGNNPPGSAYDALIQEANKLGITIRSLREGDRVGLGLAEIRVLAPVRSYKPGPQPANNDSLVMQARYGQTSVLLEGDAEAPLEHALLAQQTEGELRSTVLKIGHHGSVSSTRPEFLASVAPGWAVISCGRRNRFGHPRIEVLTELAAAHIRTLSTDADGAVCLALDGRSVTAQAGCPRTP